MECNAIMKQKDAKGKKCWRPAKENGYCGIHQKQVILLENDNKRKCKTYRCIQFLELDSTDQYCNICIEKKNAKKGCEATIDQGLNKGNVCNKKLLKDSNYCGKHHERYTLINEARNNSLRICDDGKRSCKNYTEDGKLLCNTCLQKCREYDNNQYNERKKDKSRCITCGVNIEQYIIGGNEKEIQKCEKCYKQLKEIECKRIREERNYNQERKKNIDKHYREYKIGAIVRNIWFELNMEEFKSIVAQPCFYCNTFNINESLGIDRIYSDLGYCIQNCVSCCSVCNMMKNDMDPLDFINHIEKIANTTIDLRHKLNNKLLQENEINYLKNSHKSYVRKSTLLKFVKSNKLDEYIQDCIIEKRSEEYINKIKDLKNISNKSDIIKRNSIKNIFKSITQP
jgi:uncharacterized protein (DUF1499 family)